MEYALDEVRGSKETLFEQQSRAIHRAVRHQCKNTVRKVKGLLATCHEKPVHYLDLALTPCHRYFRADHVKFEVIRHLPPACAEHLILENEMHWSFSLQTVLMKLSYVERHRLRNFDRDHNDLEKEWYDDYLRIFRERFESMDRIQRKTSVRGMLNTRRLLNIKIFHSADYVTWIRECTSPETDPSLTIELLETLGIRDSQKSKMFLLVPDECLETMVRHAKDLLFDFWGLWRGIDLVSDFYNPVSDYIYQGRNPLATLLLNYGFPHPSMITNYRTSFSSRMPRNSNVQRKFERYIPAYKHIPFMISLIQNRPRLIMTIFMAFDETEDIPVGSVATLTHVMRCVPDPYVLPAEIDSHLRPYIFPERGDDLTRACDAYREAKVYGKDELYTQYKPRTLKHLCRCDVRKALANNLRLPEVINELVVPERVKKFLLLEF